MKNKIRIQLIERCPNKLQFVKLIKDCTGLGLKEAKNVCDRLHDRPDLIEEITVHDSIDENGITYSNKFINGMKEFVLGEFIVTGGLQWDRNIKMLSLGIADESEYIDFVNEFLIDNRNLEKSQTILRFALSKLSKEELQEVFNEINKTLI
jgi:hypothetical protein